MNGMDGPGTVPTADLMHPLSARFHSGKSVLDSVLDRPVVADLEVQEVVMLETTPVSPKKL